ncbi:MAG: hypothetical protein IJD59_10430 [Clostridia bacterium]|nr:hypothetical protein [Clostridia bacterium]
MKRRLLAVLCFLLCPLLLLSCGQKKSAVSLGNVMILGDSYSTFQGSIPEEYPFYYSKKSKAVGVTRPQYTWWGQVLRRTDSSLALNCSYSGSTVCHTGYSGSDAAETSFLGRFQALRAQGYFENTEIDTLIVYGGLNDFWASSPRGEVRYENLTADDAYCVYPAFIMLFTAAKEVLPEARILFILEEYLDEDMKNSLREIFAHLDVEIIELGTVSKQSGHPDKKGMKETADQILDYLNEQHQ